MVERPYVLLKAHSLSQRSVKITHLFAYCNYSPYLLQIIFKVYKRKGKKIPLVTLPSRRKWHLDASTSRMSFFAVIKIQCVLNINACLIQIVCLLYPGIRFCHIQNILGKDFSPPSAKDQTGNRWYTQNRMSPEGFIQKGLFTKVCVRRKVTCIPLCLRSS